MPSRAQSTLHTYSETLPLCMLGPSLRLKEKQPLLQKSPFLFFPGRGAGGWSAYMYTPSMYLLRASPELKMGRVMRTSPCPQEQVTFLSSGPGRSVKGKS